MFEGACNHVTNILVPVVSTWQDDNGNIKAGMAAGMFANDQGGFLTAGHVLIGLAELSVLQRK